MDPNQQKKNPTKLILIIVSIVIIVLALGGLIYWQYAKQKQTAKDKAVVEKQLSDLKKELEKAKSSSTTSKTKEETTPTDPTADWKTYTNEKYNYTFKYPTDTTIQESDGSDTVTIQGNISEKGWPTIIITHRDNDYFNLPSGKDLLTHLKEKFAWEAEFFPSSPNAQINGPSGKISAYKIEIPRSPQAYGSWNYYFEKDSKIFEIQMLDPDTTEAQDLYNNWLITFKMN